MKKRSIKVFLAFILIVTSLSFAPAASQEAQACYPAYKCMNKNTLPASYKLYFSNPDRSLGIYMGATAIGAAGLIPGMGLTSFLAGMGVGANELIRGYMSYKVYIMRSPDPKKKGRLKTVYYKEKRYRGATKTVYKDF